MGLGLAAILALAAVSLQAQQPYGYGAYGYGAYGGGYPSQYAAPPPQYNYAQPQYTQPQYADPQYSQPQYSEPQYLQPQYSQPQYAQPDYTQQLPNAQQAYPDAQQAYPDAQQPYGDAQLPDLSQSPAQFPDGDGSAPAQPLSADNLEQLVAPIALYPDNLLAQILAASTYPAQVAVADQWVNSMREQGYGSSDQIAAGAAAQNGWDPSVKALTAFPQVLDMLNQNLQWTTNLGNAYYNQPQDVMQTVQVLRQRAEQAGNLQDTPQEDVTSDQGYIEVAPSNPELVYVPAYNPWNVYGQPVAPYPDFSLAGALGSFFGGSPVQFGLGIAMAAFEHMPFGWLGWGLSWLTHSVLFNQSAYSTHSSTVADWGFAHGGQRAFGGRGLPGNGYHTPQPYNRSGNSYGAARGASNLRGGYGYAGAGRNQGYGRENGYTHPQAPGQLAYNRVPQQFARPQAYAGRPQTYAGGGENYGRSGYGYGGYANRPTQSFGRDFGQPSRQGYTQSYSGRPGMAYASPYQAGRGQAYREPSYRAPEYNSPRGAFSGRGSEAYGNAFGRGDSFARNERSGGFHLFGNSRESGGFNQGRAPKGLRGESFGGGHAPKGYGHEKAPRESHSGGHGHRR